MFQYQDVWVTQSNQIIIQRGWALTNRAGSQILVVGPGGPFSVRLYTTDEYYIRDSSGLLSTYGRFESIKWGPMPAENQIWFANTL